MRLSLTTAPVRTVRKGVRQVSAVRASVAPQVADQILSFLAQLLLLLLAVGLLVPVTR